VNSEALAAENVRLQGLNISAKGTGQGASYDFNGKAVVQLLNAGDFQLNAVQVTGGVMGTGSDFRWVGELRAAAEKELWHDDHGADAARCGCRIQRRSADRFRAPTHR
jgi:hypothetical protein